MTDIIKQNHSLHVDEVLPIISKISIFGGLSDKQLNTLFHLLEQVSYKKDEYVFRRGDEPSQIYIVISGMVKLIMEENGTPLELIAFSEGHNFGETAMLGIQPHSASALATEDTELIVLSRQALLSLHETDPKLFGILILNIAREACRRIHNTDEVLLHYFCKK